MMALSDQQIAQATEILVNCHRNRQALPGMPADCTPTTAAEAMAIQLALNGELGVQPAGWKVGFTSAALLEKAGDIGPMLGAMPVDLVRATPATFSVGDFTRPIIEFEIGYRMGADLPPRDSAYSEAEVLAAVDSAIVGIEIADPHFDDVFSQPVPNLIADNGVAGGFISGPDIPNWRDRDLAEIAIEAFADGEKVADGMTRDERCDAPWVVTWTANQVARYGDGLKAGDYITTGAAAPPAALGSAREWQGRFDGVGDVTVRFTD